MVLVKNGSKMNDSLSTSTTSLNSSFESASTKEFNDRTVYLGDLDIDMTENQLYKHFDSINIAAAKISKQPHSSYAHITFENAEFAKHFLEMAILQINNKIIRIMPFNQPNNFDPEANLIIKNLENHLNESDIIKKFKRFGQILSCKLVRDDKGESKCYAYLQFQDRSSASDAIDQLNNTYWDERCDPDYKYKKFQERLTNLKRNQIFGKLNESDMEESELYNDSLNKIGKKIYVGIFKKKNEYSKIKSEKEGKLSNLYVKNFGNNFGDRDLFNLFKPFGSIKSAKVRRLKVGLVEKPLGCGFVDFENPEDAEKARINLDGFVLDTGRRLSVTYADCKSRRLRKKLSENNHNGNVNISISNSINNRYINQNSSDETIYTRDISNAFESSSTSSYSVTECDIEDEIRNRKISLSSDSSTSNYTSNLNDIMAETWSKLLNTSSWNEYKLFGDYSLF